MKKKVNKVGRPPSDKKILIIEMGCIVNGYSEAAKTVKGNRGCVYLCLNNPFSRKKHKGYSFRFV